MQRKPVLAALFDNRFLEMWEPQDFELTVQPRHGLELLKPRQTSAPVNDITSC